MLEGAQNYLLVLLSRWSEYPVHDFPVSCHAGNGLRCWGGGGQRGNGIQMKDAFDFISYTVSMRTTRMGAGKGAVSPYLQDVLSC